MDDAERTAVEQFDRQHRLGVASAQRRVEQVVLGSDYGATSYTTLRQANELGERLQLRSGVLLLDLGTGSGWPGIHLAKVTGCRVVLSDQPIEGLRVARQRTLEEGVADRCGLVGASGNRLPFRERVFDAITHTDVCC